MAKVNQRECASCYYIRRWAESPDGKQCTRYVRLEQKDLRPCRTCQMTTCWETGAKLTERRNT